MAQIRTLNINETIDRLREHGLCIGPKAERVLERASCLLAERERLLGIENAYTKEA